MKARERWERDKEGRMWGERENKGGEEVRRGMPQVGVGGIWGMRIWWLERLRMRVRKSDGLELRRWA